MNGPVLFACSKCFSRHPFEELSTGQQMCKECRGSLLVVKCIYCRAEYQPNSKGNVCRKCEQNVKQYGKPRACEYCNVVAAFIGSKCQRCTNSEIKYGPAVLCDQCKQRSAFDRHDDSKKVDGKLLCWLCMTSYKRALLKARQVESERRLSKKRLHGDKQSQSLHHQIKETHHPKKSHRPDGTKQPSLDKQTEKASRPGNTVVSLDPNSSDHVVAMTQLKEQIASLQKKLLQKDRELLEKDKQITELKSKNFQSEIEMRNRMKDSERFNETKVDLLNKKVSSLLKEIAVLSRSNKRIALSNKDSGSGTDSPSIN